MTILLFWRWPQHSVTTLLFVAIVIRVVMTVRMSFCSRNHLFHSPGCPNPSQIVLQPKWASPGPTLACHPFTAVSPSSLSPTSPCSWDSDTTPTHPTGFSQCFYFVVLCLVFNCQDNPIAIENTSLHSKPSSSSYLMRKSYNGPPRLCLYDTSPSPMFLQCSWDALASFQLFL